MKVGRCACRICSGRRHPIWGAPTDRDVRAEWAVYLLVAATALYLALHIARAMTRTPGVI